MIFKALKIFICPQKRLVKRKKVHSRFVKIIFIEVWGIEKSDVKIYFVAFPVQFFKLVTFPLLNFCCASLEI